MALRTSVFIGTSLDGFIARPDGDLAWLTTSAPPEEDHGYDAFMRTIDVLVMGRSTFETVRSFGAWPYGSRRVVVLSRTLSDEAVPTALRGTVAVHPGPVDRVLCETLEASGATHAYIDGGQVIQAFLREDLLEELVITRIPVLLGNGVPLFGALPADRWWSHVATRSFASGLVQSTYHRNRTPRPS